MLTLAVVIAVACAVVIAADLRWPSRWSPWLLGAIMLLLAALLLIVGSVRA